MMKRFISLFTTAVMLFMVSAQAVSASAIQVDLVNTGILSNSAEVLYESTISTTGTPGDVFYVSRGYNITTEEFTLAYYRYRKDTSDWLNSGVPEVAVSGLTDIGPYDYSLAVNSSGEPVIIWKNRSNYRLMYSQRDGGGTWYSGILHQYTQPEWGGGGPGNAVQFGSDGSLYVAHSDVDGFTRANFLKKYTWNGGTNEYDASNFDGDASNEKNVSTGCSFSGNYEIADMGLIVDGSGATADFHYVFSGQDTGNEVITYCSSTDEGDNWSTALTIFTDTDVSTPNPAPFVLEYDNSDVFVLTVDENVNAGTTEAFTLITTDSSVSGLPGWSQSGVWYKKAMTHTEYPSLPGQTYKIPGLAVNGNDVVVMAQTEASVPFAHVSAVELTYYNKSTGSTETNSLSGEVSAQGEGYSVIGVRILDGGTWTDPGAGTSTIQGASLGEVGTNGEWVVLFSDYIAPAGGGGGSEEGACSETSTYDGKDYNINNHTYIYDGDTYQDVNDEGGFYFVYDNAASVFDDEWGTVETFAGGEAPIGCLITDADSQNWALGLIEADIGGTQTTYVYIPIYFLRSDFTDNTTVQSYLTTNQSFINTGVGAPAGTTLTLTYFARDAFMYEDDVNHYDNTDVRTNPIVGHWPQSAEATYALGGSYYQPNILVTGGGSSVPEFSTYVYIGMILVAFGILYYGAPRTGLKTR